MINFADRLRSESVANLCKSPAAVCLDTLRAENTQLTKGTETILICIYVSAEKIAN